jgi:type VI secretion system secreted protein Hcp
MPIPAYMEIEGIKGEVDVDGRKGFIEVLEFDHKVHMPVDRKDFSQTSGTRVHGPFVLTKLYDKASPILYDYLVNGKEIPVVKLHWYEIDAKTGQEQVYFTHTLREARVIEINQVLPNVDNPLNENLRHMERVALSYGHITWKCEHGNTEASDTWKIR